MDVKSYFSLPRLPFNRFQVQFFKEMIDFKGEQLSVAPDENGMNKESIIFRLSSNYSVKLFQKVSATFVYLPQKGEPIIVSQIH
jgi:hypothetical protein